MVLELLAQHPQFAQLVGVGILWINLHCSGMCGPLVIGLDIGGHLDGGGPDAGGRARRLGRALRYAALFQTGRATTAGLLGGLAGACGRGLQHVMLPVTQASGLLLATVCLAAGLLTLAGVSRWQPERSPWAGRVLAALVRRAGRVPGARQRFLLGLAMGLLPCMVTFWALGLAASTQSVLQGAALMVLLVAMTSGVVCGFAAAPAVLRARQPRLAARLPGALLLASSLWLGLVAAAANGWIAHRHVTLALRDEVISVMLW